MSDNNFNIKGLDFSKLPEGFNVEDAKTPGGPEFNAKINAVFQNKGKEFDINDGLNKQEAEYIILEINENKDEEITQEELKAFLQKSDIEVNISTRDNIDNIVGFILKDANAILNPTSDTTPENVGDTEGDDNPQGAGDDNPQAAGDTQGTGETPKTQGADGDPKETGKVSIQKWGSTPQDGYKYANDCLDHIMRNFYPEITPYTQEWRDKETEIMNANQGIYGDENGVGARRAVGGTGRHSAVLYDTDVLSLPGLQQVEARQGDGTDPNGINPGDSDVIQEPVQSNNPEDTPGNTGDPANASAGKVPEDATLDKTEDLDNGMKLETYVDADGNIVGRKQLDGDNLVWESSIEAGEGGTTIETKRWKESGNIEQIVYKDNKEIQKNSRFQDGTSKITFEYDENGNKTAGTVTYLDAEGNQIGTGKQEYASDGSYTETTEYNAGEYANKTVETKYDANQTITEKTITDAENNKCIIKYENGAESKALYYDKDDNLTGTREFEYHNDHSYTETITYSENNQKISITFDDDTITKVTGDKDAFPEFYTSKLPEDGLDSVYGYDVNLEKSSGELALTNLSDAEKRLLDNGKEITIGDYTIQKTNYGYRTLVNIEIEENGILKNAQVIIKEENPTTGEIKVYEMYGSQRRIKSEIDANQNRTSYIYMQGIPSPTYDAENNCIIQSDERITIQGVSVYDKDGKQISHTNYAYTDDNNKTVMGKTVFDNGTVQYIEQTAKIDAYAQALKNNLTTSKKAEFLEQIFNDSTIHLNDMMKIYEQTTKDMTSPPSFAEIFMNSTQEASWKDFAQKMSNKISGTSPKQINQFFEYYKKHSKNGSFIEDIQQNTSYGNENEALATIFKAIQDKVGNTQLVGSDETSQAKFNLLHLTLKTNGQGFLKQVLGNVHNDNQSKKEALALIIKEYGSIQEAETYIRKNCSNSEQEQYMKLLFELSTMVIDGQE